MAKSKINRLSKMERDCISKYMEGVFEFTKPSYQQPESKEKTMTREEILAANIVTLKETGLIYKQYIKEKNAEVETLKEAVEAAKEASKAKDILTIHALLEDGFPIERIAKILKIEVSYAIELAKLKI